jgi:uncharacterized protein (TIGR02246 family)
LPLILFIVAGTLGISMIDTNAAAQTASSQDKLGIEKTLAAYNGALNEGETAAVLPLYTDDGVFMAPFSNSHIGKSAIRSAYDGVFAELQFNVKFHIAEIVEMSPYWAFVRTNSAGTTAHHSTGKTTSEANHELFVLEKGGDGMWRIARYSFSPTNPSAP